MTFQQIAPSRPPRITCGSTMLCSIIPPPTALATATLPVNSAAKLKVAAQNTAASGLRTRVPTIVAMEFAESWKPLLKSKMNAIKTIATTYPITESRRLRVLERDALQHLGDTHAAIDRALEGVVHLLPFHHLERIGLAGEERADGLVIDRVPLFLEMLDQRDVLGHLAGLSHFCHGSLDLVGGAAENIAELLGR